MVENVDGIRRVLEKLDEWRNLPAYRLETRADPFFGMFMGQVIGRWAKDTVHDPIPEFPLRLGSLRDGGNNQSYKVDFVVFSKSLTRMYLVELKTDAASKRDGQDQYLAQAKSKGLNTLLDGVIKVAQATSAEYRPKYRHLFARLGSFGAIRLPDEFCAMPEGRLASAFRGLTVAPLPNATEVIPVYVQPHPQDAGDEIAAIDFDQFSALLPDVDPVAEIFKEYLREWQSAAGSAIPETA